MAHTRCVKIPPRGKKCLYLSIWCLSEISHANTFRFTRVYGIQFQAKGTTDFISKTRDCWNKETSHSETQIETKIRNSHQDCSADPEWGFQSHIVVCGDLQLSPLYLGHQHLCHSSATFSCRWWTSPHNRSLSRVLALAFQTAWNQEFETRCWQAHSGIQSRYQAPETVMKVIWCLFTHYLTNDLPY